MNEPLFHQLSRIFSRQGFSGQDVAPIAVALLVAVQEDQTSNDAPTIFRGLANRLKPQFEGDASEVAADWLSDPGLSAMDTEAVSQALAFLRKKGAAPVDWSAELAAVLSGSYSFGLSLPISRAISRAINLPITGTCACLFRSSASIAWVLSADREVTVFPADRDLSIILTLLARAACRPLKVNRRNPLDGTHMPAPFVYESLEHRPPFEAFDFIISAPPFGQRIQEGQSKGTSFEVLQAQRLIPLARRSFNMLVTDGLLFRESRSETEFREWLVQENGLKVTSLPTGIWGRGSGLQTSLITTKPGKRGSVAFVDGRTMENASRSGREQEVLILQHLDMLEDAPTADVPVEEVAANAYSLAVSRYVLSGEAAKVEAALENCHTVRLGEVARIIRPKAPLATRGLQEPHTDFPRPKGPKGKLGASAGELVRALEITPSDIIDGHVELAGREVLFDAREAARLNAVRIEPGDILVSIKGTIGVVGLVDDDPIFQLADDPPWIVSQSLAIIRVELGRKISPALLNAILTAPAARAQMQRLAGGSTVPTLSIGSLKDLEIPLPDQDDAFELTGAIEDIDDLRTKIGKLSIERAFQQKQLRTKLWNLPYEFGED